MNTQYPIRVSLAGQRRSAKILVGVSLALVASVRVYTLACPGPCLPALVMVVSGLVFGIVGLGWYLVCGKAEE